MYRILKSIFPSWLICLLLLSWIFKCSYAQDTLPPQTAIELEKMNVLYYGLNNPVKIVSTECPLSSLEVSADSATVTGQNGEYYIYPKKVKTVTLSVKCNGKEIQKSEYRVKSIGDIDVCIRVNKSINGIKHEGVITKKELLNAGGIELEMINMDFDWGARVVEFTVTVVTEDEFLLSATTNGDRFSVDQISIINKIKNGQKLWLEDIVVSGPMGECRKMGSRFFYIEDARFQPEIRTFSKDEIFNLVARKDKLWIKSWQSQNTNFSIKNFNSSNNCYASAENRWNHFVFDSIYYFSSKDFFCFSKDKSTYIDIYKNQYSFCKLDNKIIAFQSSDLDNNAKILIVDAQKNIMKSFSSYETDFIDNCLWMDNNTIVLLCSEIEYNSETNRYIPVVIIYDISKSYYWIYKSDISFQHLNDGYFQKKFPKIEIK